MYVVLVANSLLSIIINETETCDLLAIYQSSACDRLSAPLVRPVRHSVRACSRVAVHYDNVVCVVHHAHSHDMQCAVGSLYRARGRLAV